LYVVDAADLKRPSVVGEIFFPWDYRFCGVATVPDPSMDGHHVCATGGIIYDPMTSTGWFQILDVSSLERPAALSNTGLRCCPFDIEVEGSHAYIADVYGLQVVDVIDPYNPVPNGAVDTPHRAYDVAVAGSHAYVADQDSGLQVIDITDPHAPQIIGSADTPGAALGVALSGAYAYVADDAAGLQIIDVQDPETPTIVGSLDTPGSARSVVISDGIAYIADWTSGLQVVDVTDPSNPVLIGSLDTPGYASKLTLHGDHAFMSAGYDWGLQAIDISDPRDPWLVSTFDFFMGPGRAVASRSYLYLASSQGGFLVIEMFDPEALRNVGYGSMWSVARGIALSDSHLFIVDTDSRLRVYPRQCEPSITPPSEKLVAPSSLELSVLPNPASSGTSVRLFVPIPGYVRASILDVSGRHVRSLRDGLISAGPRRLYWDGRDDRGRSVAAGIYWVRVVSAAGSSTRRVVVLQ
jgi:hypothetical protein